ncbi:MAG TPA: hypothetical protein VFT04_08960 [Gemmatimonadales bacterium]|nr:hypothetical protein [Gemmatimonadales bacterium]
MTRRFWMAAACALTLASVGACGDDTRDTAEGTGAVATPPASNVSAGEIRLGNAIGADKRVTNESDDFRPTETIYASVATTGVAPNANLVARWTYQDGQVVSTDSITIAPNSAEYTEFHISNPGGFPAGDYKLEVFMNGQSVGTKDFDVE